MNHLALAQNLIQQGHLDAARKILEHCLEDTSALFLLALLSRYHEEFDNELMVLQKLSPNHDYILERLAWHKLPWRERLVPRKTVPPTQPRQAPSPAVLEKSAIVTGADAAYFPFLTQAIESVQNSNHYQHIPLCILDCGLTDEQKHILQTQYKVHAIQTARWIVEPRKTQLDLSGIKTVPLHSGYKGIMNKPFLFDYFPEFDFIFWMDADAWVQDDRALDTTLRLTEQYGIGIPATSHYVATTIIGLKKDAPLLTAWQKNYKQLLETRDFFYASEDRALEQTLGDKTYEFVSMDNLYLYHDRFPFVREDDDCLYDPATSLPIGVFAFNAHTDKKIVCCPLPLEQTVRENSTAYETGSQRLLEEIKYTDYVSPRTLFFPHQKLTSLHYRVLSRFDKGAFYKTIEQWRQSESPE